MNFAALLLSHSCGQPLSFATSVAAARIGCSGWSRASMSDVSTVEVSQREGGPADDADPRGLAGGVKLLDELGDTTDEVVTVELIAGH